MFLLVVVFSVTVKILQSIRSQSSVQLLKMYLGLVPFLRLLDVFGGQVLILQADVPQSSRQVRFSHLHIYLHVLLLVHLVLQLQHFLHAKHLYLLFHWQFCGNSTVTNSSRYTCAHLLQPDKRQFKLSVGTFYSRYGHIPNGESYLIMQLLEEVYFLLKWFHLPLQVQSGKRSIVHIL